MIDYIILGMAFIGLVVFIWLLHFGFRRPIDNEYTEIKRKISEDTKQNLERFKLQSALK